MGSSFRVYLVPGISWFTLTMLLVGLLLQFAFKEAEVRFHIDADGIFKTIQEKISVNEAVLDGLGAFFGIVPLPDDESTRNYARAMLRRYPHIYMIEAQTRIASSKKEELERRMRNKGYEDFRIRTFSYEGDRSWTPVPPKPDYYPITFMEPVTDESRQVLGLDIDSVPHLRNALHESIASEGAVATAPFRLVEGDLAYVLFRPAFHSSGGGSRTAETVQVVSLVVLAEDLLSDKHVDLSDISCALFFHDETGGGRALISQVSQQRGQSALGRLLLPVLSIEYQLDSRSQPFGLTLERQLDWDIVNPPLVGLTFILSSAGFVLLLYNLRRRLSTERERAEAYRLLEDERGQLEGKIKARTLQLYALTEKLFRVQEQERRTLARELHDEIGQTLTAIKTEAALIKERCGGKSPEIGKSAEVILVESDGVYNITHNIMRRLRPRTLDDLGLIPSLNNCIAAARLDEQGIGLHVRYDGELGGLGEQINITLYRILQEALINVGKHAGAKNVWVEVSLVSAPEQTAISGGDVAGAVQLTVRDDGRGMNSELPVDGLGLIGVRERVRALRGRFDVKTAPGEGFTFSVTIPLQKEATDHG